MRDFLDMQWHREQEYPVDNVVVEGVFPKRALTFRHSRRGDLLKLRCVALDVNCTTWLLLEAGRQRMQVNI